MLYSWRAGVFIHLLWNNAYDRWITSNFPCKWHRRASTTSGCTSSPVRMKETWASCRFGITEFPALHGSMLQMEKSVERLLTVTGLRSTNWTVLQNVLTCPYSFIPFSFINFSPNIQSFKFRIPALPVRASVHGHTGHQSPGDGAVIYTICSSVPNSDQARAAVEAGGDKCYCRLFKTNISNYFIGKRPKKLFFLVSFFIFSPHSPRPTLISYSRSSPHHNQSFYNMFCFTTLGSLLKSIWIFQIEYQTTLLVY